MNGNSDTGVANSSRMFFGSDFPADEVFQFYAAHCDDRPENRELCIEGDGWRRRFVEAPGVDALRELVRGKGVKALHAGAVFSGRVSDVRKPVDERESSCVPVGKELVFDLDLQDNPWVAQLNQVAGDKFDMEYNDRYMPLLFASANILQVVLEQVYGFKQFMAVYSGRRGVHLYVLDRRAFLLTEEQRHAICVSLTLAPQHVDSPFLDPWLWPSLSSPELEKAVNAAWVTAMGNEGGECGLLGTKAAVAHFSELFAKWKPPTGWKTPPPAMNATAVFARLCTETTLQDRIECLGKMNKLAARDVVLAVVWPRIDVQVTAKMQHTLKTPFSLHAATARVAVPVRLDAFQTAAEGGGWRPAMAGLESWRACEAIKAHSIMLMRRATRTIVLTRSLEKKRARGDDDEKLGGSSQW